MIKIGDTYKTKNPGDFFGSIQIKVTKIENGNSPDGFVYFDTAERMHNRKHHKVRVWWITDWCRKVTQYETLKEAGYQYVKFLGDRVHVLYNNATHQKELWFANKNHASYGLVYKNTHLEFASSAN